MEDQNLTQGNILTSLLKFAIPVFFALFLQAMYGAVDLVIVGKFAEVADQSGVASGSMLMSIPTTVVAGLSMGITVFIGEAIGSGDKKKAGDGIGAGICLFLVITVALTIAIIPNSGRLAVFMHAPEEALSQTAQYILVCGIGIVFILAYNVLGAVFRGIGDSKTPLFTVAVACVVNIVGDLIFVAGFHLGAAGAVMGGLAFFGGSMLASIFSNDPEVIAAAHSYLKAYAIDCLLTASFFCFVGYFNDCEKSFFVMMQGLIGAFCVRIPVVYLMSRIPNASLFMIGLGTPASSLVQTILCIGAFFYYEKRWKA